MLLAYFFLLTRGPMNGAVQGRGVEAWLNESAGVALDFELADALTKLEACELLEARDARGELEIIGLATAGQRLEARWQHCLHEADAAT